MKHRGARRWLISVSGVGLALLAARARVAALLGSRITRQCARERAAGDEAELSERYEETQRERRLAKRLSDIARIVHESSSPEHVFEAVARAAIELCASDSAKVAEWDSSVGAMVFRAWPGTRYEGYHALRLESGKGTGGHVMVTGQSLHVSDYLKDSRFTKDYQAVNAADGHVAELVVPIKHQGRVAGLIYVGNRRTRVFSDHDEQILLRLAEHAAVAITNARLFGERRAAEMAARESARRLTTLVSNLPGYTYRVANDPDYTAEFISEGVFNNTRYTAE
jgi:signal transduction protein with GAF and PtsI domain